MVDMAMHMMDIAQNSIRAEAENVDIDFFENSYDATLLFRVKDDGNGMNPEELKMVSDPFFTTRITRKVGLGIPFLKMNCEQTGGGLEVFSVRGEGTSVEAICRTDNPDCLPLGDIAGYLTLLLRANPDIRIRFSYRIDSEEYLLDTKELEEQGISLQQQGMSTLLKSFIETNLKEIYSYRSKKSYLC